MSRTRRNPSRRVVTLPSGVHYKSVVDVRQYPHFGKIPQLAQNLIGLGSREFLAKSGWMKISAWTHHEHRTARVEHHRFRNTPQHPAFDARSSVRAHRD